MIDVKTPAGTSAKVYLPTSYDGTKKMPLMVFLHGIGEKSDTNLNLVLKNGTPDLANRGTQFDFVMIIPQLKSSKPRWDAPYIDECLEFALKTYAIDPTQIYMVGLSLGGGGVWAYMESEFGKKIAAFVPMCGSENHPDKANMVVASGARGWAWHCTNDQTVPFTTTERMVKAVNNVAGTEIVKFNTCASNHSGCWIAACNPQNGLYDWLKLQRRPGKSDPVIAMDVVDGAQLHIKTASGEFYVPLTVKR